MTTQLAQREKELAAAQAELNRIAGQMQQRRRELEEVNRKIEKAPPEMDPDELAQWMSKRDALRRLLGQLDAQHRRQRFEVERAEKRRDEVLWRANAIRQEIAQAEAQLTPGGWYDQRIKEAERELATRRQVRENKEAELERLRATLAALVGE